MFNDRSYQGRVAQKSSRSRIKTPAGAVNTRDYRKGSTIGQLLVSLVPGNVLILYPT